MLRTLRSSKQRSVSLELGGCGLHPRPSHAKGCESGLQISALRASKKTPVKQMKRLSCHFRLETVILMPWDY